MHDDYKRSAPPPTEILLIDDDDNDVVLIRSALENERGANRVHRVEDGIAALEFLRREGKFVDAPRPDLIFLDLNMPRMDGHEVLKAIKDDPVFQFIPVIVLTTSEDQRDVLQSYELRANGYVTKPLDLHQFRRVLKSIRDYWASVVKLPSQQR